MTLLHCLVLHIVQASYAMVKLPSLVTDSVSAAIQICSAQRLREANLHPQGLRVSRSGWNLLLPDLLQHCWRISRQLCWLSHSWLLLLGGIVQREQNR